MASALQKWREQECNFQTHAKPQEHPHPQSLGLWSLPAPLVASPVLVSGSISCLSPRGPYGSFRPEFLPNLETPAFGGALHLAHVASMIFPLSRAERGMMGIWTPQEASPPRLDEFCVSRGSGHRLGLSKYFLINIIVSDISAVFTI